MVVKGATYKEGALITLNGTLGTVYQGQLPMVDASENPRFKKFSELVEDTYEAFLSVPLVNGGEVIGVVNVHHREAHEHTPAEIATLSFIGEQLGVALSKSLL